MFWDQDSKSASPSSTAQTPRPDSKAASKSAMAALEPVVDGAVEAAEPAAPAAAMPAEAAPAGQTEQLQAALAQLTAQVDSWLKRMFRDGFLERVASVQSVGSTGGNS